ncbi:hypothetical protein Bbelb_392850 [Branchiostoma belcheri]|nr:hypothetical protein Bbelb_392850 [Branchiostoma belcheri]
MYMCGKYPQTRRPNACVPHTRTARANRQYMGSIRRQCKCKCKLCNPSRTIHGDRIQATSCCQVLLSEEAIFVGGWFYHKLSLLQKSHHIMQNRTTKYDRRRYLKARRKTGFSLRAGASTIDAVTVVGERSAGSCRTCRTRQCSLVLPCSH